MAYTSTTPNPSTPVTWSDDPLVAEVTEIKKAHLVELRNALESLDGHIHAFNGNDSGAELPNVTVSWVEPSASIVVESTEIKASHYNEIIQYIKDFNSHYHNVVAYGDSDAYTQALSFDDDPLVANVTDIKAASHEKFRTYLENYSTHTHDVCCECECTCTCQCQCTCTCTEECCGQCWSFD